MIKLLLAAYAFSYPYELLWLHYFGRDTVLKPYRVVGLAILGLFFFKRLGARERMRFDGYDAAFAIIIAGGFVMALFWYLVSGDGNLAWAAQECLLITFSFVVYIVAKHEVKTIAQAERILVAFVAGTLSSIVLKHGLLPTVSHGRLDGFFKNPNGLALAIAISLLCVLAWLFHGKRTILARYSIAGFLGLFLSYVLLSTGSRMAALALLVSAPFLLVARPRSGNDATWATLLTFLPVAIGGVFMVVESVTSSTAGAAVVDRYSIESARVRGRAIRHLAKRLARRARSLLSRRRYGPVPLLPSRLPATADEALHAEGRGPHARRAQRLREPAHLLRAPPAPGLSGDRPLHLSTPPARGAERHGVHLGSARRARPRDSARDQPDGTQHDAGSGLLHAHGLGHRSLHGRVSRTA